MAVLVATFAVCLLSALVPVVNAEAYLVATAVVGNGEPGRLAVLALAAAAGQMLGKMAFFCLGAGLVDLPRLRRKARARGRWSERMEHVRAWAERRPWGPAALTLLSAFTGLPPFAIVSVLAGTLGVRWWVFLVAGFAGRYARFLAVLLAPSLVPGLLPQLHG